MLALTRLRTVRHALVIMLMILSAFIAVERAQSVVNGVQHALAIAHDAPNLAFAAIDDDHDHDHGQASATVATEAGDQDQTPGAHHHHLEGPQVAALTSPLVIKAAASAAADLFMRQDTGSPQSRVIGLERPPKALVDQA